MKTATLSLLGASLLTLAACGGAEDTNLAANDSVNVASDDLILPPDETVDPLGDDLNGVDANIADLNAVDLDATDANLAADANLTLNSQ